MAGLGCAFPLTHPPPPPPLSPISATRKKRVHHPHYHTRGSGCPLSQQHVVGGPQASRKRERELGRGGQGVGLSSLTLTAPTVCSGIGCCRSHTLHSGMEVKPSDLLSAGKVDPSVTASATALARTSLAAEKAKSDAAVRTSDPFKTTAGDTLRLRAAGTKIMEHAGSSTGGADPTASHARTTDFTKSFKAGLGTRR
jgi:hypothetical protein